MSSFTTQLKVIPLDNGKDWEVIEEFTYYIGELGSETYVTVPVGFITDFASVPRILWSFFPPWGKYGKAAVIHDFLWVGNKMVKGGEQVSVDRKTANFIFLEAMGVLEVNVAVRYVMYWAVCANAALQSVLSKFRK